MNYTNTSQNFTFALLKLAEQLQWLEKEAWIEMQSLNSEIYEHTAQRLPNDVTSSCLAILEGFTHITPKVFISVDSK